MTEEKIQLLKRQMASLVHGMRLLNLVPRVISEQLGNIGIVLEADHVATTTLRF